MAKFDSYEAIENSFGRKDRYVYARVVKDGELRFMKTSISDDGAENLRRELAWADFMGYVEQKFPELRARVPRRMELLEENSMLMEYIDAPLVARPGDGTAWSRHIDRYVDILAKLDLAAGSYSLPKSLSKYKRRTIADSLKWWLRDVELTEEMVQALEYIEAAMAKINYAMQHGDLTPWQIFDDRGVWVIYDGERSGDDLPRFNDLAYSYGRLAARSKNPEGANLLLNSFVTRSGIDENSFLEMFSPVLLFRALGMIGDAVRERQGDELAILQGILTRTLAGKLLS